jgi:hypothetical protein
MNKTMMELAKSLPQSENRCLYCNALHPDIAPITGPNAWHIIPDKILGFASVCPDCWKL